MCPPKVHHDWNLHISIFHLLFKGKLKSIPNSHHSSPYDRDGTAYDSDASALFVQVFQNLFPAFHKTVTKALLGCFSTPSKNTHEMGREKT